MKKIFLIARTVMTILAACLTAGAATGCGKASGAGEKQIRSDIESNVSDISANGLTMDSVKIDRRQTSAKERTDYIRAEVTAGNEHCTCSAVCEMNYGLYNDGWKLDWVNTESSEIIPKITAEEFDQSIADNAVEAMGYTDYWLVSRNEYGDRINFKYGGYEEDGTEMIIGMEYDFSPSRGWYQFTSSAISANMAGW